MKLKVPNCLQNKISCHTVTGQNIEAGMRGGTDTSGPSPSEWRPGTTGIYVSCILAADLLLSTCFFLTYLWFSSVVFKVPSGTYSALCFQEFRMLRSKSSKATYTGLFFKVAFETISLKEPVFQQIQQERRVQCFTWFSIWHLYLKC